MKFVTMSLAAAMLLGASAYAEVKVDGNAQLFYGTLDANDEDLFSKTASKGNASASLDLETEFEGATVKVGTTYLTTMGLEGQLVNAVWAGDTVKDQVWIDELNFKFKLLENTAMIAGRQYLETPLAFSETWNIVPNSMDAFVFANSDVPETTLIGAYVSRGNGASGFAVVDNTDDATGDQNLAGNYVGFGSAIVETAEGLLGVPAGSTGLKGKGAYAAGAVTTAIPMTTAQLWYYDVVDLATAVWLQADVAVDAFTIGAQYGTIDPSDDVDAAVGVELDSTTAYAAKVGFTGVENLSLSAAFSVVDEGNSPIQMANTATGAMNGAMTPLYTEAWWNFGYVGASGTTAYNVAAEYAMPEVADFGAYFTSATLDNEGAENDMIELTLTATKTIGTVDATLAYINTTSDDVNDGDAFNEIQVYLTYNF